MKEVDLEQRIAELEQDNRRLRRLLSHTSATKELRHRLTSTLAMLRIIIRRSADTSRDLEHYVAHVEDRMNAIARAQSTIDAFGEFELGALISSELLQSGAQEGKRAKLSGPLIFLQPRAGQVLTLAAHELSANALEHGALTTRSGRIDIVWRIHQTEKGHDLEIVWKETEGERPPAQRHEGFGHEVLMRMLPYELNAVATCEFSSEGLRYGVRFALTERIGREEFEDETATV